MKTIGIIAEYNPFHNGHAYQIQKVKELTGADHVVIAMSGDFVQRGTPAIIDKYIRAEMALNCGADLVLELPVLWATASAESFAMAGVTLFDKIGCIDGLCFGAETEDLKALTAIADILAKEPEAFSVNLSSYLKEGFSFPAARARALSECNLSEHFAPEDLEKILNTPNNILAIEYLKALQKRNSNIKPILIKREGTGYHDADIHPVSDTSSSSDIPNASATAIRRVLFDTKDFSMLTQAMPKNAETLLRSYLNEKTPVCSNDFSSLLGYKLLTSTVEELSAIGDCNPDLANRLLNNRTLFSSFEDFCMQNKRKDTTYTRISRILLHFILGITNLDYLHGKTLDYIPYLRILGFKKDTSIILKNLKAAANVPVISKLADAPATLSEDAKCLLHMDIFASDLYEQICAIKKGTTSRSEYSREIVRV